MSIAPCTTIGRGDDAAAGAAGSRATHAVSSAHPRTDIPIANRVAIMFENFKAWTADGSMRQPSVPPPSAPRDHPLYADVIGGLTTFFTMAYIVVVNPAILATAGTGM